MMEAEPLSEALEILSTLTELIRPYVMISNPFATDIHSPAITGTTNDTVSSTRV
jgi:hypothetical protein